MNLTYAGDNPTLDTDYDWIYKQSDTDAIDNWVLKRHQWQVDFKDTNNN